MTMARWHDGLMACALFFLNDLTFLAADGEKSIDDTALWRSRAK